jgi:hypothetical protein
MPIVTMGATTWVARPLPAPTADGAPVPLPPPIIRTTAPTPPPGGWAPAIPPGVVPVAPIPVAPAQQPLVSAVPSALVAGGGGGAQLVPRPAVQLQALTAAPASNTRTLLWLGVGAVGLVGVILLVRR